MKTKNFMPFNNKKIGQENFKVGHIGNKLSKDDDIGTPMKLLHEGEGHRVTIELKNGDVCQGTLIESENNWTSQLESITYTSKKLRQNKRQRLKPFKLELIFIRGQKIRFFVFPNMLNHVSLFKIPSAKIKEEEDDNLMLSLKLLHLTKYTQKIAVDQGRYYL